MEYYLENDYLKVKINSFGAELKEIYNKKNNTEYMWNSNKEHWGKSSPILFPNIGKFNNNKYLLNGKVYTLSKHGFARENEFEFYNKSENSLSLILNSSDKTMEVFPFEFSLIVTYLLSDKEITISWTVINNSNDKMYFAIGGHPAFNAPLKDGVRSDCYFYFDKEEIYSTLVDIKTGYLLDTKLTYKLNNGYLNITDDLFKDDALVIENQDLNHISICGKDKKPYVTLITDAPVVGLWSISDKAPFVCIEPWYGICDKTNYNDSIEKRPYQNNLASGETFYKSYKIIIH